MTENLRLKLEADKTYTDWGSYNDGSTFDLVPGDSSTPTWTSCDTDGACVFNGNTTYSDITNQGYYSWYTATGGKGIDNVITSVNGSICPKGWRLPSNYTANRSFAFLLTNYLGISGNIEDDYTTTLEAAPLSFTRTGRYSNDRLYNNNVVGNYWQATCGRGSANYFRYSASYVYPSDSLSKFFGHSIRCVAL